MADRLVDVSTQPHVDNPGVDASDLDAPAGAPVLAPPTSGFHVRLEGFEGPFDLLLGLIAKHKLDVTEVALSQVTDEFLAYIRAMGTEWDLGQVTEFLVVAATLLDLKAARLLPSGEVEDEEDVALLEARDILFARLLQYRAYKQAAALLAAMFTEGALRYARSATLEPRFAEALPEVLLGVGPEGFARIAAQAFTPKIAPVVGTEHVHVTRVSVREHAIVIAERLRRLKATTFRALCQDCEGTLEVVARFLALLELYREGAVGFEQLTPLGELHVRWVGEHLPSGSSWIPGWDDDETEATDE
ncbi:MAG: segregation and condensation protein [Frankiaceae bacterium]|jgi:segregation and condensation protein A|nr:segregation and condensation protein [Frankiaceae bacterium]MDQ1726377.1 segregation and condensation protein [Frankiaceae bacterium]